MSLGFGDLGVLGQLAKALGIFDAAGNPRGDWFGQPETYLGRMLADAHQREALIAFVDEALGGADRSTEAGIVWLPVVTLDDPPLTVAVTIDSEASDGVHIGVGLKVGTTAPASSTTLSIPLFRAQRDGAGSVGPLLLLGAVGGRLRIGTRVTIDSAPPVPGQARLGAVGLDVDLPTAPADPKGPEFGLVLSGLQLPGATAPRDVRVAADSADELDDAVLDLVLSLVRVQAEAAAASPALTALAGLLGLRSADAVPDFPITQLPTQGTRAIALWIQGIVTQTASRTDWLGHAASLLGGTAVGDEVQFTLGEATLTLGLGVATGATGHTLLTPRLGVMLGNAPTNARAQAELLRIDLATGEALALPSLGLWAATGHAGQRVLDVASPTVARADTLRVGFALDAQRRLNLVLAADQVVLGSHTYPTLDLTSPDAVMDAAGATVAEAANELLASLGSALGTARQLLGLDAVGGVPAISLTALMTDPVAAVAGYWRQVLATPSAAVALLGTLRNALADASQAAAVVQGNGTGADPWRLSLIGPLTLEAAADGAVLTVAAAVATSVDTLGQRCTVVGTTLRATLARVDLQTLSAQLMVGAEARLTARERGASPPRVRLVLEGQTELLADEVSLALTWSPQAGLSASAQAPNARLRSADLELPVALPRIAADGSVSLPAAGWDAVQLLVGHLARLGRIDPMARGVLADLVAALGWDPLQRRPGGSTQERVVLRLVDLMTDAPAALAQWLPRWLASELGPRALDLLADLVAGVPGAGAARATFLGRGHPDDPYRVVLGADLPQLLVWFPPQGPKPLLLAAPQALRDWRPGQAGLDMTVLEQALWSEAGVAADLADLLVGRARPGGAAGAIAAGLAALAQRWAGGDGRIVPPAADATSATGIDVRRVGLAAGQLWSRLDLEDLTGRVPTTTVHVTLGASAWPDAPAERCIDLTAAGLEATMFTLPAAAAGNWYVALGTRADCKLAGSTTDGTPEQAQRLARVLDALQDVATDIALVAVAGAGHAARLAAHEHTAVADLVLLGTPLEPIALTALTTQPTADALRLLHRLLPTDPAADEPDDADLSLGRTLVAAMMELADLGDPGADLRPPLVPEPAPRAGLNVVAQFGAVAAEQVAQAMTAVVAAGLAERARRRVAAEAAFPAPAAGVRGVRAGLRWALPTRSGGQLAIDGSADLSLVAFDRAPGGVAARERVLRARLRVTDRAGWLAATPDLSLRAVSVDVTLPLDGTSTGTTRLTLHDARVFGQDWERLVVGIGAVELPVLPEVRVLLAALVQRVSADVAGPASVALADVMQALGLVAQAGGVVADAVDQLIHDPGGLVRQRLALAGGELSDALHALLGPLGSAIDFAGGRVRVQGGGQIGEPGAGRFGWSADVDVAPGGVSGTLAFGPDAALPGVGGVQVRVALQPFAATLHWHHPGGGADVATLWPAADTAALARMVARAAPSLGAQIALELLRRADDSARPLVDALLDALGLLAGATGDAQRALRPLAGLLRDPAGWLRSAGSVGSSAPKVQALLDALRPLMGLAGAPGSPLPLATGVTLTVASDGGAARLDLGVDPSGWAAPPAGGARLAGGLTASLRVAPSGPPTVGLSAHVGLAGAPTGRQAVHASLGPGGVSLFLRPASGPDIALVPFSGLGALSALAEAALPFLLDQLAAQPAPVGPLVQKVGDALALRSGAPAKFDAAALRAWAANPAGALLAAAPSIAATGLSSLAPLLDAFTPATLTVGHAAGSLTLGVGAFTLGWGPAAGSVSVAASDLPVPGIDKLGFKLALSSAGLDEVSVTVGPADIDAGGVSLKPFVTIAAGNAPAGGRRVAVGMAVNDARRFALRWLLDAMQVDLVASNGLVDAAIETTDAVQVALRLVDVVADLVAAVAMAQQAVQDLLDESIGTAAKDVRFLLQGVVLADAPNPTALIGGLFDPATLLTRAQRLFKNIADAQIVVKPPGTGLTLQFAHQGDSIGLQVGLASRTELVRGDVMLWLENDGSWISSGPTSGGLFVGFVSSSGPLAFKPSLAVNGLGLRIGRSAGPLLELGLTIESIALHVCAAMDALGFTGAGVQLQFSHLAVSASGAGGSNGIAQGIMRDTGPTPPKPAFSPALAVQKHGSGGVAVTLRAGDPPGPWWIAIQKGFGPLYLEQVGFDARMPAGRIERVSLLMDGSVSMFGLTCAVDDLQITYLAGNVASPADFFSPESWRVDLAGLAVSANMAGVWLAGGLLKQVTNAGQPNESIEYLGMLLGRFAVYGLTVYGGYGQGVDAGGQKFTAFFAIGAVNGPIGGPPAFFLTGIGGGFGINRLMRVPTDLSNFGDYPLIQALDIAATPGDPMAQLRALGSYFPMQKGTFWFAAGLSFTSFALVDGIAVVGVQVGDGLDINLLGLARMALPRPQVALVSIEVALLVRFSSSEGVLWVQGQLTDNSWLLYPDIKLTGGFAYVIWFKGEHAGEFVFTLGGYHPSFHRAGYPQVPRLGLRWSIGSNIVIKAGSYFALTSEALMAGGDFEGSARFGPAWAEVKFGAHGIVYFDPFHYQVNAYARIAAGVTIDTWLFGEITISVSLGARIDVEGPDFHGSVTFEVGPIEITFEFGGSDKAQRQPLSADAFIAKYLEAADGGGAQAHALMTGAGALPAKGEQSTPDGSSQRPFVVVVEFSLTFTSTVPASSVRRVDPDGDTTTQHPPSRALAVAPMISAPVSPQVVLTWKRSGEVRDFPFAVTAREFGRFPVGVWGPAGDASNRKVPKAEMIEALQSLDLVCRATPSGGGPEIPYHQVEIGKRLPLPFSRQPLDIAGLRTVAQQVAALVPAPATVDGAFAAATQYLRRSATPTALAALRGEREAPPRTGTLAEGLESPVRTVIPRVARRPAGKVYDHFIDAPLAVGLLTTGGTQLRVAARARTTVKDSARAWRVSPPTLASVMAERSRSIAARLVIADAPAAPAPRTTRTGTLLGRGEVPATATALAPTAMVARTGAPLAAPLASFGAALAGGRLGDASPAGRGARATATLTTTGGATLAAGQIAVLRLPNAHADAAPDAVRPQLAVAGAPARVVLLGTGGQRLADVRLVPTPRGAPAAITLPRGTERIAVLGLGDEDATSSATAGLSGWHAGQQLPYVGWGTAVAAGCVVQTTSDRLALHRERVDAGWIGGAELARGETTVTTTFAQAPRAVCIVLDDPAAGGAAPDGRQLLMGLDGAERAVDASGRPQAPVLLAMDNRSVLAYDVVPASDERPVVVTIASQPGWSLVGVLGSAALDATGAVAFVASRGLDAALLALAPRGAVDAAGAGVAPASRLLWRGPVRTAQQRRAAQARASGTARAAAPRPLAAEPAPAAAPRTRRKAR